MKMSNVQANQMKQRAGVVLIAIALAAMLATLSSGAEAKLLRRSRYFDDYPGSGLDSGYSSMSRPTGERAIVTVRGTRSPYDGTAPSRISIEDNPYRGPYPRGVYDRLDAGYPAGRYPRREPFSMGGYGGGFGGGYGPYGGGSGYGSMFGAPNRIAVTGAYPYGYGSRF